jgi:hypothetical protein
VQTICQYPGYIASTQTGTRGCCRLLFFPGYCSFGRPGGLSLLALFIYLRINKKELKHARSIPGAQFEFLPVFENFYFKIPR